MVELQIIPIDEADGGMRTERWNGEHFQKVATDLESQPKLALGFGFSILSVNLSASSALSFNVQRDFVFAVSSPPAGWVSVNCPVVRFFDVDARVD